MKKITRYLISALFMIIVILLLATVACFRPVDMTPYQEAAFYRNELDTLATLPSVMAAIKYPPSTLEAGWSRVNLLPPFTTPIAIDDKREGRHFEGVHDSIYVRAFVFKKNGKKIAYISADLLIIPPAVTRMFDTLLATRGFDTRNIYFTATHTHTSIGAWHDSYVGVRFAGKFDPRIPPHIARCIADAIIAAEKNCSPAKIGYAQVPTSKLVMNRLVHQKGKVDSLLRIVRIEKQNGENAAIITFSAHCTVFHRGMMLITGDWAGLMMDRLDTSGQIAFACFSAGSVGSHGPYDFSRDQEKEAQYMADHVAQIVTDSFYSIQVSDVSSIAMQHIPLLLREPEMRIAQHIAIRPWLFKKLFGDEKVYINTFRLGDIYFVGTPCDFSGELDHALDSAAAQDHLHLLITSFNGGYIGYVTDSRWYDMDAYETRTMGWFGPGNGDYISEVIRRLLAKKY